MLRRIVIFGIPSALGRLNLIKLMDIISQEQMSLVLLRSTVFDKKKISIVVNGDSLIHGASMSQYVGIYIDFYNRATITLGNNT